jgi:hypothetical protein
MDWPQGDPPLLGLDLQDAPWDATVDLATHQVRERRAFHRTLFRLRDLLERPVLAEGADVEVVEAALHGAGGECHVLAADRLLHVEGGEPGRPQPLAVELDADLAVDAAADVDGAHAGDLLEAARQLLLEEPRHLLASTSPPGSRPRSGRGRA